MNDTDALTIAVTGCETMLEKVDMFNDLQRHRDEGIECYEKINRHSEDFEVKLKARELFREIDEAVHYNKSYGVWGTERKEKQWIDIVHEDFALVADNAEHLCVLSEQLTTTN